MKNIIYIAFLVIITHRSTAQQIVPYADFYSDPPQISSSNPKYYKDLNNNFTPFIGKWTCQIGNKTFILHLWKEDMVSIGNPTKYYMDNIYGHYELIENYNDLNPTVIYTSDKLFRGTQQQIEWAIDGSSLDGIMCNGHVFEFSVPNNSIHYGIDAHFGLQILSTNPTKATFSYKTRLNAPVEYHTLNLPNNIIMTKIN